jgi:hypothetical protein
MRTCCLYVCKLTAHEGGLDDRKRSSSEEAPFDVDQKNKLGNREKSSEYEGSNEHQDEDRNCSSCQQPKGPVEIIHYSLDLENPTESCKSKVQISLFMLGPPVTG